MLNQQGFKNVCSGDFPGSPMVKTPHFQCRSVGSISGRGTKIPHAAWHSQKKKKCMFCMEGKGYTCEAIGSMF